LIGGHSTVHKRHTEEQIVQAQERGDRGQGGGLVPKVWHDPSYLPNWKAKYAGMSINDLHRLMDMEVAIQRKRFGTLRFISCLNERAVINYKQTGKIYTEG